MNNNTNPNENQISEDALPEIQIEDLNIDYGSATTHEELNLLLNTEKKERFYYITFLGVFLFFYASFMYYELIVRIFTSRDFFHQSILYIPLLSAVPSFLFALICNRKSKKIRTFLQSILSVILVIYYCAQLVIYHIFGFYLSLSAFSLAGQATSYYKEAIQGIIESSPQLLLTFVPLIIFILFHMLRKRMNPREETRGKRHYAMIATFAMYAVLMYSFFLVIINTGDKETFSPYDLYYNTDNIDESVPVFGAISSTSIDIYRNLVGFVPRDEYELSLPTTEISTIPVIDDPTAQPNNQTTQNEQSQEITEPVDSESGENVSEETAQPVYQDHVMNIDFESLSKSETNSDILKLNNYFAALDPTSENDKTGIYEGYNVIYMTCEAFSPYAVDKDLTPTLYKMATSGYLFENFYTTGDWYTSTSDGEYMMSTGLLPMSQKNTFKKTATNYFAFSLPHMLLPLGYQANAFHDNSGTVYGRNLSHPNLGYNFYYDGNGLDVGGWPESDLDMMIQSMPMYENSEPYVAYYMTVSGHLNYTFSGNTQSNKHKDEVSDLPYSEACKAYIACNIELDLAMEYVLNQLKESGQLDHTIIVMVADHYPYGLTDENISEFLGHPVDPDFERYQSTLILYDPGKTEQEIITKQCEAIDVLPTVLNMLGVEYDSRLLAGRDIFDDEPGLVIFPNRSFITDTYSYNHRTKEVNSFSGVEISKEELDQMKKNVDNTFYISSKIAELDYYRVIGLEFYTN